MSTLMGDLKTAWRLLHRYRATSLLILIALTLGIGANAAIFAIARGVLLRPLPYEDPERLVLLWGRREGSAPESRGRGLGTPRWFREIPDRQRSFSSMAAIELWNGNPSATFDLASPGGAERLRGAFATRNVFDTFGVRASIGRTFAENDADDVAVISHELWQRLFAASPDVIGRQLELATERGRQRAIRPVTIIGVLPPRVQFSYPESTDVWLPLSTRKLENPGLQDAIMYRIVARLRDGTTLQQAHDDMAAVKAAMVADLGNLGRLDRITFWLEPVHENAVSAVRPALQLLAAVAMLVFVVACLNVATLLLAQTVERRRDVAVRLALGATRARIFRQLVTESGVMAAIAALVSVTSVSMLQPLLRVAMPPEFPRVQEIGVDLMTVGWITAIVTLAVVLSTVVPAWRSSALDPGTEIGQTRTATSSRSTVLWRHGLVASQVAVVVVLLVAGGLLLRSFWRLQQVDLGFDGERVFTAEMRLLDPRYFDSVRLKAFQSELLARVRALPGVERASITSSVPLRGVDWTRAFSQGGHRYTAKERDVDPDYFAVMGIPLLAGRAFSAADEESAAPVVIVSRSLADRLFPGQSPLGRRLELGPKRQPEIVGVVGDVRNARLESAGDPAYYVPRAQQSSEIICLVVRTTPGAPDLAPAVRAIVASLDPMQPIFDATTIDDIVSESIADRRFYAVATAAFALVTLLLAAAGLYGVTSFGITARTREIGVRMALGASPRRVIRMLVAQGVRPVIVGVGVGLIAAFWASRMIERFLFDVRSDDAAAYAAAAGWVLLLTLLACLLPARRAARLNPTTALRHE